MTKTRMSAPAPNKAADLAAHELAAASEGASEEKLEQLDLLREIVLESRPVPGSPLWITRVDAGLRVITEPALVAAIAATADQIRSHNLDLLRGPSVWRSFSRQIESRSIWRGNPTRLVRDLAPWGEATTAEALRQIVGVM